MDLECFDHLRLTVETTLSPNLAKNVVDGGRLTTTSTICSSPLVAPQEGLSSEMTQSPPTAGVSEANCCVAGQISCGLDIRRALGRAPGMFGSRLDAETVISQPLVEDAELVVASCPNIAFVGSCKSAVANRE